MKKLILLLFIVTLNSCFKDSNDADKNTMVSFDVSMSIPSFGVYGTDKSTSSQASKSSSFEHIFKDAVDVVFTSTTSDFTATLTINPNDLSNTPSIDLAYGTYSWTISNTLSYDDGLDYNFPEYLPIYGSGSVEVFSSSISLDLLVDTDYGLVTVQKENIDSAKIHFFNNIENGKSLILKENIYYIYSATSDGLYLSIEENKYNTTIQTAIGESSVVRPKTHYNYILAFSDVDVNSITLKTAAFEQFDYYLQPTGTVSSTCSITLTSWFSDDKISQTVAASSTISRVSFIISTTCSETINYTASGLPTGISMEILEANTIPSITGTVSSSVSSGTYNFTITAFNSDNINTATASATVTGTIIVTGLNPIYLDENGVTIKAYDWAEVGDKGIINGIEYTVVNNLTIENWLVDNNINLCTTLVTNMNNLFKDRATFNSNISFWDTSNVQTMSAMFFGASSFNQNIGAWDVSNVVNMRHLFSKSSEFNQPIGSWNVSNVTDMYSMFSETSFNQDIGNWNISKSTNIAMMFASNPSFNQNINNWDTSNVTFISYMFFNAISFNQDIGNWDVSQATTMEYMFNGATAFNQDISAWNVSNVNDMDSMFVNASSFNQNLSDWCVTKISSEPTLFGTGATSWTLPKPVWGTCPE